MEKTTLTKDDFVHWKNLEITQLLRKFVEADIKHLNESLVAQDVVMGDQKDAILMLGVRKGMETLIDFIEDGMSEETSNEKVT